VFFEKQKNGGRPIGKPPLFELKFYFSLLYRVFLKSGGFGVSAGMTHAFPI